MKLSELCPVDLPPADLPVEVIIGPGAHTELADVSSRHLGENPLILADSDTWTAAGEPALQGELMLLQRHPHADDATVQQVLEAIDGHDGVIAIGSGTINDLAKRAAHLAQVPYVVLGTAASMNGYASGIAAILSHGLKTTVPARPPMAIVLDTEILAAAPARLTQAGLGDLMSKPVSDSDWWLANQLEGTGYSELPSQIVDHAVEAAITAASGLARRDAAAHGALGAALVLSGVAMVVAGSSSPASGGEHLLSHLWDMERLAEGHETRLHGAQVGVTTCITAALYQRLISMETVSLPEPPPWAAEQARLENEHGTLASVVIPQAKKKYDRLRARAEVLREKWSEIRAGLEQRSLPTSDTIRAALAAAGAPSTLVALDEPRANATRVFRLARDIRDRVTVLDLAFEVGVLPRDISTILDDAGV
jgi:glycerol-1-phosphate dehydrogenase [NAD(P)+]